MVSAAALITALKLARSCTAGVAIMAGTRMMPVTNMTTCACAVNMPNLLTTSCDVVKSVSEVVKVLMAQSDTGR